MWPLEFGTRRRRGVLRIGRERAEYWACSAAGLELRGHHVLSAKPGTEALLEAELHAWLETIDSEARGKPLDLVLESAWLPVLLLELGRSLWSRAQVENLLRHRLAALYANPGESASGWQLQLDHRVGDPQAIGYGLAPSVSQAVLGAMAAAGLRAASLQPAFAWGWQRFERRRRGLRHGWWTWVEQDRAMVCRMEHGRITAMNAGAAMPSDDEEAIRLVAIEAARMGIEGPDGAAVTAGWNELVASGAHSPTPRSPGRTEVAA
ncbi:hypothetical protein [Ideonella sp. YS5]|uniref:hypothetical protein n=1 Tax=Ideonella sp. YS5 TaxID=3453714 RepID=UPI003EEC7FEC